MMRTGSSRRWSLYWWSVREAGHDATPGLSHTTRQPSLLRPYRHVLTTARLHRAGASACTRPRQGRSSGTAGVVAGQAGSLTLRKWYATTTLLACGDGESTAIGPGPELVREPCGGLEGGKEVFRWLLAAQEPRHASAILSLFFNARSNIAFNPGFAPLVRVPSPPDLAVDAAAPQLPRAGLGAVRGAARGPGRQAADELCGDGRLALARAWQRGLGQWAMWPRDREEQRTACVAMLEGGMYDKGGGVTARRSSGARAVPRRHAPETTHSARLPRPADAACSQSSTASKSQAVERERSCGSAEWVAVGERPRWQARVRRC
jgi:hypothetical protein